MGLLPGAKAESAATKTIGSIFPKLFGKSSFAGLSPMEYMNKFGGPEAFAKQFPHTFSDLQPHLPQTMSTVAPNIFSPGSSVGKAFGTMTPQQYIAKLSLQPEDLNSMPAAFAKSLAPHMGLDPSTITGFVEKAKPPPAPLSDDEISAKLAKNPGASIFDVAGTDIEGPGAPWLSKWPKKVSPIGEPNPQVDIKNLSPEDEAARQQRMQQDYPTRLYHGVKPGEPWRGPSVANNDYLYMAENPELANMYAGVYPGNKAPYGVGQVVPVQADTSKFHVFDAKGTPASSGEQWAQVNNDAIREAKGVGAPGVTIKNVFDEPANTKHLGQPQNIHILLDKDWNQNQDKFPLRSPFAMFNPSQYSANNLLAGLAGGAVAAPAVTPQVQDYVKALQGGSQDQQQ